MFTSLIDFETNSKEFSYYHVFFSYTVEIDTSIQKHDETFCSLSLFFLCQMAKLSNEQQETELAQSPDVESINETTQIEQSHSKSLIESLLFAQTQENDTRKKKIKTNRQKELERLTKATKSIFSCCEELNIICERIDSILSTHRTILLPVCRSLDILNSGRLSYEQFRLIIRDFLPEMSLEDSFVLTKLFQVNDSIDYRTMLDDKLNSGILRFITPLSVPQSSETILEKSPLVPNDSLQFNHSKSRYLIVHVRLITFDSYDAYLGHVHLTVSDQISIYTLSKILIDETDLVTKSISIFREKIQSRNTLLDPQRSLESYGYIGAYGDGTHQQQFPKFTFYYDFLPMHIGRDCPILKCDYYMK
ncbi:hypothetical protein I4U23_003267 [Adineta vaga]|nr:hypothetical protein I4U23_003267 [Adineta vaga]